jgi:antirestriction protein ArdC
MSKSTEALTQAHERLTQAVESIVSGDDWQRMLRTAAKFHRYSFPNLLLISFQNPDATLVAGFRKWKSLNRVVRKGEKGLAIFAPCKYRVESDSANNSAHLGSASDGSKDGAKKMQIRGFRVVHVFDISQTDGEPIEDLDAIRPKLLDGDAPEGIWDALVTQASAAGFEVVRDQKRSENGYCDFVGKKIAVRPDVASAQALKTLIHELGHALLHSEAPVLSREVAEVEVESVAYIVCDALGLDTGDYSFAYVARWADGFTELVKDTAERVVGCAKEILEGLGQSGENDADMEKAS